MMSGKCSLLASFVAVVVLTPAALIWMSGEALAFGGGNKCPTEIHRPCCPSPCPVADFEHRDDETEIRKKTTEQGEIIGASRADLDVREENMTPVAAEELKEAGIVVILQAIRNVIRGPDLENRIILASELPDIRIPEIELTATQLPSVAAMTRSYGPGPIETLRSARERVDNEFSDTMNLDDAGKYRQMAIRKENARQILLNGWARAQAKRNHIAELADEFTYLEARLLEGETLSEDFRVNAEMKVRLLMAMNEFAELFAFYVRVRSAHELLLVAQRDVEEPAKTPTSHVMPESTRTQIASAQASAQTVAVYRKAVRDATKAHNALTSVNWMRSYMPALMTVVEEHDARKEHMWLTRLDIQKELAVLYVNPDKAWRLLKSDLLSDDSTYGNGARYKLAKNAATKIVAEVVAQKPVTRYGERVRVRACENNSEEGNCIPFTQPGGMNYSSIDEINEYYATVPGMDVERYEVVTKVPPMQASGNEDNLDRSGELRFQELVEYRLESRKRKVYWDDLRRGDATIGNVTTASVWNEFLEFAPHCLYGPMPSTQKNLAEEPEWFDVNPQCDHRYWAAGDYEGWPINHMELGGVDQSLWLIENRTEAYYRTYGGREDIDSRVETASSLIDPSAAMSVAYAGGRPTMAQEVADLTAALNLIAEDDGNQTYISHSLFQKK